VEPGVARPVPIGFRALLVGVSLPAGGGI